MGFLSSLFGSSAKTEKLSNFSEGQEDVFAQLLQALGQGGQLGEGNQQALSQLMQMLDPSSSATEQFSQPYINQFNQQTVPGLAERFAGVGGGLSSSGFGQALGSAGAGLQTDLAGMKSQLQQNALSEILNQYKGAQAQALGAQPFSYQHTPAQKGLLQSGLEAYLASQTGGLSTLFNKKQGE